MQIKKKNPRIFKKQILFALFFLAHCAFWMFKMAGWVWHLTSLKWKSRSCTKKREGSKGYVFMWRIEYPKPGFWIFKAFFFYILQKILTCNKVTLPKLWIFIKCVKYLTEFEENPSSKPQFLNPKIEFRLSDPSLTIFSKIVVSMKAWFGFGC